MLYHEYLGEKSNEDFSNWLKNRGSQKQQAEGKPKQASSSGFFSLSVWRKHIEQNPQNGAIQILQKILPSLNKINSYQMLGLNMNATPKEIREAYRFCSKYFHPDRFFKSSNEKLKLAMNQYYKRIVKAYTILKNPTKKAQYDQKLLGQDKQKPPSSQVSGVRSAS